MKHFLQFISYVAVAAVTCALTLLFLVPEKDPGMEAKLYELQTLIEDRYIGDATAQDLYDGAAAGMVDGIGDRWSFYMSAAEFKDYQLSSANVYVGVGIVVQDTEDGYLKIIELEKGGGALDAGIQVGDVVVAVEGISLQGMEPGGSGDLIRGEEGTYVKLTVRRAEETLEFSVQRRRIETAVATATMLADNIGLVRIENFDSRCSQETLAAIEQLRSQGAASLIFDVRNNRGGYKDELVEILDYLLPEGPLFRSEYYNGKVTVEESDASFLDMPMAVLVNGRSYSAAEFFAAALQEYDAAVVVGTATVGKGNYQETFLLSDGSAVNLSTGRYCTPNGVSLTGVGITPDVDVPVTVEEDVAIYAGALDPAADPQIQAAVAALAAA